MKIKVPATTANLGPGYDCVGLSLSLYNIFEFTKTDERIDYGDNLIYRSFKRLYDLENIDPPNIRIEVEANIPQARGLGSSASCIIAGLMAANKFLGEIYTQADILNEATAIEGHPDNVVAAYIGGLVISASIDGDIVYIADEIYDNLNFYAIIPDFELSTEEARKVVPKKVDLSAAVENIAMSNLATRAIEMGDLSLLLEVARDNLHEPYRKKLIDGYEEFKKIASDHSSVLLISGAGPTMLVISEKSNKKIEPALLNHGINRHNYDIIKLEPANGAEYI